jgi:hypothetical protein
MVHKVWDKDTNGDSEKGIREDLIESYERVYFKMDPEKSDRQNLENIVRNLIRYCYDLVAGVENPKKRYFFLNI